MNQEANMPVAGFMTYVICFGLVTALCSIFPLTTKLPGVISAAGLQRSFLQTQSKLKRGNQVTISRDTAYTFLCHRLSYHNRLTDQED